MTCERALSILYAIASRATKRDPEQYEDVQQSLDCLSHAIESLEELSSAYESVAILGNKGSQSREGADQILARARRVLGEP